MEDTSRRDVSTRNASWAKTIAQKLAHMNVSPNSVSIASMAFAGISLAGFAMAFSNENRWLLLLAILGIQGRLLCNLFDGMIAVEYHKKSNVGELYNEVPDRISDALIIFGAGYYAQTLGFAMPMAWAAIFLSTMTAYIRVFGASLGIGHHFIGPMAKQHRMALITIAVLIEMLTGLPLTYYSLPILIVGLIITNIRRLMRVARLVKNKN